jgi:hypothetical protein
MKSNASYFVQATHRIPTQMRIVFSSSLGAMDPTSSGIWRDAFTVLPTEVTPLYLQYVARKWSKTVDTSLMCRNVDDDDRGKQLPRFPWSFIKDLWQLQTAAHGIRPRLSSTMKDGELPVSRVLKISPPFEDGGK